MGEVGRRWQKELMEGGGRSWRGGKMQGGREVRGGGVIIHRLDNMLRKVCRDGPSQRALYFPHVEFAFNIVDNHTTSICSFEVVYSKKRRYSFEVVYSKKRHIVDLVSLSRTLYYRNLMSQEHIVQKPKLF